MECGQRAVEWLLVWMPAPRLPWQSECDETASRMREKTSAAIPIDRGHDPPVSIFPDATGSSFRAIRTRVERDANAWELANRAKDHRRIARGDAVACPGTRWKIR